MNANLNAAIGINAVYEKIGEVQSSVKALHDTIRLRAEQVDRLYDLMRAEILALRNEHKKLENQMEWAVRAISSERDWTREHTTIHEKDIQELTKEIADTRHLYFNLVAWRRQLVASAAVLGLLFNIALWMIEPAYRWFVERALSRHD